MQQRKKQTIALDLDDVLADFTPALFTYYNTLHHTNFSPDDMHIYHLSRFWQCTNDEGSKCVYDFYQTQTFANIPAVQGAKEAVHHLAKDFHLTIITARPTFLKEATYTWIEKQFPHLIEDVFLTNHFVNGAITKASVCKNIQASFFIDDGLNHGYEVAMLHIPVLIFNKSWNQGVLYKNMRRVDSWTDIKTFFSAYG